MYVTNRFVTAVIILLTIVSTVYAKYSGGSGTAEDPYQIATAADLIALGETPQDYHKHFLLTADTNLRAPQLAVILRERLHLAVLAPSASHRSEACLPVTCDSGHLGAFVRIGRVTLLVRTISAIFSLAL